MNTKLKEPYRNLVIAALISCGEVDVNNRNILVVPFEKDKSYYLFNYILTNKLNDKVKVQPRKKQFTITLDHQARLIRDQLCVHGEDKVFTKLFGSDVLNLNAIIVCICLFGTRKIEGISVSTNINKKYLRTLCYCSANILNHPITPGKGVWKITEITSFFKKIVHRTTSLESSTIATYLNNTEKGQLKNNLHLSQWGVV